MVTPAMFAISVATAAALPTSVWMRMYAYTTARPFGSSAWLVVALGSGTDRTYRRSVIVGHPTSGRQGRRGGVRSAQESGQPGTQQETVAALGEFATIADVTAGRRQPDQTVLGPGDDAAV